jgi:SAM-dependent methyltransferase
MSEPGRGLVFGENANSYDRFRPDYPSEAAQFVMSLTDVAKAVEVGAGTGKATASFARPGLDLTCVEPSAEMAALLSERALPGVSVVVSSFEDWPGPRSAFDLVFAAQAWHWVDEETSYRRVREMLRSGGVLALIWNLPADRYSQFEAIYRRLAPEILDERDERVLRRDSDAWLSELASAGFAEVTRFVHSWDRRLSAAEHRALTGTYSDHMLLPESRRTALLDAIEASVETTGGAVTLRYRTTVFSGVNP